MIKIDINSTGVFGIDDDQSRFSGVLVEYLKKSEKNKAKNDKEVFFFSLFLCCKLLLS